ncbi:PadR family transcriptional regulator [Arhodomonas aquaeolei]|uniref:PadR family transcriptional regulator n=1 Tax=Arhodomonas aquaeolei TaxID=2369 RepID=UPI00037A2ABD|nr:PadR family transcriptional regulator [Arhodomonas aquaeolei]
MALRFALLTALQECPATGYELTRTFRERLGHVWPASHQQIYRELARLHEAGSLAMEPLPHDDRPDAKRYRVTPAGEAALREWLAEPHAPPTVRDPFLVKLFAGELLDDAAMLGEIDRRRAFWRDRLAVYRGIEAAYFSDPASLPRRYRLQHLALRRGIVTAEGLLGWLDELAAAFAPG